jgi:hypothetical protein
MNHIPAKLRRNFTLQAVEVAPFVQLSADAYRHRDGVRFRNGKEVHLQQIAEGVRFEVLSLASSQQETGAEPQRVPDPDLDCLIEKGTVTEGAGRTRNTSCLLLGFRRPRCQQKHQH